MESWIFIDLVLFQIHLLSAAWCSLGKHLTGCSWKNLTPRNNTMVLCLPSSFQGQSDLLN